MQPLPSFYDPQRIGTLFLPDTARIAAEADAAGLSPASQDARRVHLLLIDMQVDFCHEAGSLCVPGALGDVQRVIEFIYRHAGQITQITCSLDSHLPSQIFSPNWWADAEGHHPAPFTIVSAAGGGKRPLAAAVRAGLVARLCGPAGAGGQEAADHLALPRVDRQPRPYAGPGSVVGGDVARAGPADPAALAVQGQRAAHRALLHHPAGAACARHGRRRPQPGAAG
ncbi:MAG: hypothetical protein V9H69_08695 [Anaerolineae bacterium]